MFFFLFFLCRPLPSQNRQQEGSQWLLSLRLLNERLISFTTLSDYKCVCVCVTQAARQHMENAALSRDPCFTCCGVPALSGAVCRARRVEGDALRLHRCCNTFKGPPETLFCLSSPVVGCTDKSTLSELLTAWN